MNDPIAQGQLEGTESPVNNEQESNGEGQSNHNPGIQQRFDQLTRERHETERRYQEMIAQQNEQIVRLTAMMAQGGNGTQQNQPQEVAVPEGMDPEVAKYLKAQQDQMFNLMKRQQDTVLTLQAKLDFQQKVGGVDPRVAAKAQELLADWKRTGKSGWVEEDALTFASGLLGIPLKPAAGGASGQPQPRQNNGQFAPVLDGHAALPTARAPGARKGRPANFDSLPLEDQVAIMESELGDTPL